jgi:hypothetical protein
MGELRRLMMVSLTTDILQQLIAIRLYSHKVLNKEVIDTLSWTHKEAMDMLCPDESPEQKNDVYTQ